MIVSSAGWLFMHNSCNKYNHLVNILIIANIIMYQVAPVTSHMPGNKTRIQTSEGQYLAKWVICTASA